MTCSCHCVMLVAGMTVVNQWPQAEERISLLAVSGGVKIHSVSSKFVKFYFKRAQSPSLITLLNINNCIYIFTFGRVQILDLNFCKVLLFQCFTVKSLGLTEIICLCPSNKV